MESEVLILLQMKECDSSKDAPSVRIKNGELTSMDLSEPKSQAHK